MSNYTELASQLLQDGNASLIVGFSLNSGGIPRPAFVNDEKLADGLVFNEKCTQNLAVYLTKHEVRHQGRIAIFANLPIMRSILVLLSERQLTADAITIIGFDEEFKLLGAMDIPAVVRYVQTRTPELTSEDRAYLDQLESMSIEERFKFWNDELSACIRCYACRQSCPMCYCNQCAVECNQPQWISTEPVTQSNYDWHILRAMHLAGRCVACGDCGRACPVGIPCHLLTIYLTEQAYKHFGTKAGMSDSMESVMSTYKPNDKDNFII